MEPKPRSSISEDAIAEMKCAICGDASLRIVHLDAFPDYVACDACGSSFLLEEDGDRVLYGEIPAIYPTARRKALRHWVSPQTVEGYALAERLAASEPSQGEPLPLADLPGAPAEPGKKPPWYEPVEKAAEPSPKAQLPFESTSPLQPEESLPPKKTSEPTAPFTTAEAPEEPTVISEAPPTPAAQPATNAKPSVPPRHRVLLQGRRIILPRGFCVNCMKPNPKKSLEVAVIAGAEEKGRRLTLRLPLCNDCAKQASALSPEQRDARLMAHMISIMGALFLIVTGLLLRIVDFSESPTMTVLVLGGLGVLGYAIPLALLLPRVGHLPPPAEADAVRATLRLHRDENDPNTLAFDWHNAAYAQAFLEANQENVIGEVTPVEQAPLGEPAEDPGQTE
jgi:hypothetical protein